MALRITQQGLEAVGVKDDAAGAAPETSVGAAPEEVQTEAPAAKLAASRRRTSAAAQKGTGTKYQSGMAKTKAGFPRKSPPGSKQSRVIVMLQSPCHHCRGDEGHGLAAAFGARLPGRRAVPQR